MVGTMATCSLRDGPQVLLNFCQDKFKHCDMDSTPAVYGGEEGLLCNRGGQTTITVRIGQPKSPSRTVCLDLLPSTSPHLPSSSPPPLLLLPSTTSSTSPPPPLLPASLPNISRQTVRRSGEFAASSKPARSRPEQERGFLVFRHRAAHVGRAFASVLCLKAVGQIGRRREIGDALGL